MPGAGAVHHIKTDDGNWVWVCRDGRVFASVYATDEGTWRTQWRLRQQLSAEFECAEDACLAVEKWWPPEDDHCEEWFESKKSGYFRKSHREVVYVRQAKQGWYAVHHDGKLLGQSGCISWFATAAEACRAVHSEEHTPVDLDPFAAAAEGWRWLKLSNKDREEQSRF
jgi:hypothetical protein